jgi:hypothetical protein
MSGRFLTFTTPNPISSQDDVLTIKVARGGLYRMAVCGRGRGEFRLDIRQVKSAEVFTIGIMPFERGFAMVTIREDLLMLGIRATPRGSGCSPPALQCSARPAFKRLPASRPTPTSATSRCSPRTIRSGASSGHRCCSSRGCEDLFVDGTHADDLAGLDDIGYP